MRSGSAAEQPDGPARVRGPDGPARARPATIRRRRPAPRLSPAGRRETAAALRSTPAGAVAAAGAGSGVRDGSALRRETVPRYRSPATTGTLIAIRRRKVAAVCWLLSCCSSSSCCSAAACAAVIASSGNCVMNFSMVASGSRPTWSAYDRTKDRLKMPPGRREISLRSSASSAATVIFVVLEICLSDTPRCSRAALSMLPKSPEPRSAAVVTACGYVRKRIPECQTRRARYPQLHEAIARGTHRHRPSRT